MLYHSRKNSNILWVSLLLLTGLSSIVANANDMVQDSVDLALIRLKQFNGINDWTVTTSPALIKLISNFNINASGTSAVAIDIESDMESPNHTIVKPCTIEIHFLPFESFKQYHEMLHERDSITSILNRDSFDYDSEPMTEAEWVDAIESLKTHPVPSHVGGEAFVYITSSVDDSNLSFEPSEELKQCVWMKYQIGFLFSEIYR